MLSLDPIAYKLLTRSLDRLASSRECAELSSPELATLRILITAALKQCRTNTSPDVELFNVITTIAAKTHIALKLHLDFVDEFMNEDPNATLSSRDIAAIQLLERVRTIREWADKVRADLSLPNQDQEALDAHSDLLSKSDRQPVDETLEAIESPEGEVAKPYKKSALRALPNSS